MRREILLNRGDGILQPRFAVAADEAPRASGGVETASAGIEEGLAVIGEVTHRIGDPGEVGIAEQGEFTGGLGGEVFKDRVAAAEKAFLPDAGAEAVGVAEEPASGPVFEALLLGCLLYTSRCV